MPFAAGRSSPSRCSPSSSQLAPGGVEEERGSDYVEYAIYGAEGELPALGQLEAATGDGLIEVSSDTVPDDWADRWRDFHEPLLVGDRLLVRPSWEPARDGTADVVIDPGRAFGTGAHPTTRLCLELLLELADAEGAEGPFADWGTGSGVLAIAAARLGWGPVVSLRPRGRRARGRGGERAGKRGRARAAARQPARRGPAAGAHGRRQHHRARSCSRSPRRWQRAPRRLICSGLLEEEVDEVAVAFGRLRACGAPAAAPRATGPPCCWRKMTEPGPGVGIRETLGRYMRGQGPGEVHVGDPRFDDWEPVRDFEDVEGAARVARASSPRASTPC